ncbi:MAG: bifunctional cytochrome P450/NADPH--P450 reductase [Friedmanniella sp.]
MTATTSSTIGPEELPGPRGLPLLGNVFDIDAENPITSMVELAREHGPIFRMTTPGGSRILVSGVGLVQEVCDDARFDKFVGPGLQQLRNGAVGRGLFTADTVDPLWQRAHGILMSPFSQDAMRGYLPRMLDLADQLLDKWQRLNPGEAVDVPADMTSLTLDTIALCGFGYRFNSFYRDSPHPFVSAMVRTLTESQTRARQLPVQTRLKIRAQRRLAEDQAFMEGLVDELIRERREQAEGADTNDLLGRMIEGIDRSSGLGLTDENIRAQCITFLIAGHETTSGLLSFAIYYLLHHPDVATRARQEVDRVLAGGRTPSYQQVHRLTYLAQVLGEALRLWPTAPAFTRYARADTVIGNRYRVPAGTPLTVLLPMLHRDRTVWGDDAETFNPDHMAAERLATLPPHAYKPFGTGQRACIGRQFAMQEAMLVLALVLQRFDLLDSFGYQLQIKTTLTVKPDEMRISVRPRADALQSEQARPVAHLMAGLPQTLAPVRPIGDRHGKPLRVLFGSDLGTAEGLAGTLAQEGVERGYTVVLGPLDDHIDDLPADGATIVVCSSYNGTPPANAREFCRWLSTGGSGLVPARAAFTVFGCGNREWASTYQAVPLQLDAQLAERGGRRVHPRGEGDARADFDADYRAWHATLWSDLATALDLGPDATEPATSAPRLRISVVNRQQSNPVVLSYSAQPALLRGNRELAHQADGERPDRSTRHLEVALPVGMSYRTGDHLGVLPRNSAPLIRRAMVRFGLDAGQYITIIPDSGSSTHLPIDEPTPLLGVLGSCVELQDVATRGDLELMARYIPDPVQRAELTELTGEDAGSQGRYRERVFRPNLSLLEMLEQYPACSMPFEVYLDRLPPLRPRYYSISSSPLVAPEVCSITAGVLQAPARSGRGEFAGVCSTHLAGSPPNSTVFVFVRDPGIAFRPPEDPQLPMIMVGAGTGVAPYRGFLQERAALQRSGIPVAPSLLFFGCRNPDVDYLYADELAEFERLGVVRVETAFSRVPGQLRRYVQDAITASAQEVWSLLQSNAHVFVCGNAATIAPAVRAALIEIHAEKTQGSAAAGEAWLGQLRNEARYLEDIWGG